LFSQGSLVISDDRRFLFAVEAGSNEVSVLRIDGESLVAVDRVSSGGTVPVSVTVHENVVADNDLLIVSELSDSTSSYRLGPDGMLTVISGSVSTDEEAAREPRTHPLQPDGHQRIPDRE
jgi:6-phosphogluconolactonase (cycloisomerase 2 family)